MNEAQTQALIEAVQVLQASMAELQQSVNELQTTLERADPVQMLGKTVPTAHSEHPALVAERRRRQAAN